MVLWSRSCGLLDCLCRGLDCPRQFFLVFIFFPLNTPRFHVPDFTWMRGSVHAAWRSTRIPSASTFQLRQNPFHLPHAAAFSHVKPPLKTLTSLYNTPPRHPFLATLAVLEILRHNSPILRHASPPTGFRQRTRPLIRVSHSTTVPMAAGTTGSKKPGAGRDRMCPSLMRLAMDTVVANLEVCWRQAATRGPDYHRASW